MSIIGIDFGTNQNKIGCINCNNRQNIFKIISNNYKSPSTPSVAFFNSSNLWFFGEKAVKLGASKPNQCIYNIKIMLGRNFDDELIFHICKRWKFIIKNDKNFINVHIKTNKEELDFTPSYITNLILKNLICISQPDLPTSINKTIISIPSNFNKNQTNDLAKAVKLSGLRNIYFCIEPILATISYLFNHPKLEIKKTTQRKILVYSLGASFHEASIIIIESNGESRIITETDETFYAQQFDENLFDYVYKKMKDDYEEKEYFLNKTKTKENLLNSCKDAKIILSKDNYAEITLEDEDDDDEDTNKLTVNLTLDEFNEINQELFDISMNAVEKVSKKAQIDLSTIDHLFLIGGSTYIKEIRRLLNEKTNNKIPCPYCDPREAVALGACIVGSYIEIESSISKGSEERIQSLQNTIFKSNPDFYEYMAKLININRNVVFPIEDINSFTSEYSTDFSSISSQKTLSKTNSDERKNYNKIWEELENLEKSPMIKPEKQFESLNGSIVCCKNLAKNESSYATVTILKKNLQIRKIKTSKNSELKDTLKSSEIIGSNEPKYDLKFNCTNVKKGYSILVQIYGLDDDRKDKILIGKKLIPLSEIDKNFEFENEFKLVKEKNLPKEYDNLDPCVLLKMNHKVEYKEPNQIKFTNQPKTYEPEKKKINK